jgi:hypothetical protein
VALLPGGIDGGLQVEGHRGWPPARSKRASPDDAASRQKVSTGQARRRGRRQAKAA